MDRPTIEVMKNALRQKAEQMIRTVQVSYGELEELSKECEDELKSLHCTDVTVDIGKPFCWLLLLLLLLLLMSRFKWRHHNRCGGTPIKVLHDSCLNYSVLSVSRKRCRISVSQMTDGKDGIRWLCFCERCTKCNKLYIRCFLLCVCDQPICFLVQSSIMMHIVNVKSFDVIILNWAVYRDCKTIWTIFCSWFLSSIKSLFRDYW